MALTYDEIWRTYTSVNFYRKVYVKRLQEDGTYETSFTQINPNLLLKDTLRTLFRSLPNSSFDFGKVEVGSANLKFFSPHRELASEAVTGSIFQGYLRDRSIIKVVDGVYDVYSSPGIKQENDVTTFVGLIDENTSVRDRAFESFTCLDFITLLDSVNVQTLGLTQTTLGNLVYEAMNRSEFTKYFSVSNSSTYINPGHNTTSIDLSTYTGSLLSMLEDLSKGHSIFYVNPTDNYFYFKEAIAESTVSYQFLEENNRKISLMDWREGKDRQVNRWFWKDTALNSVRSPAPSIIKLGEFSADGVTDTAQRQQILDKLLQITEFAKPYFQLVIPYLPTIQILQTVNVEAFGFAPPDAARWGMFPWYGKRYRQALGFRISRDDVWMVRSINHNSNLTTLLELEKVI